MSDDPELDLSQYPQTRAEAKRQGSKFFCTGEPCKNGHFSLRYSSSRGCVRCVADLTIKCRAANPQRNRDYQKAWREANPQKVAASARAWREANPEKVAAKSHEWREANPQKVAASARAWREANPEKVAASVRAWRGANPEKAVASSRAWKKANPERVAAKNHEWRVANPEKVAAKKHEWRKANPATVLLKSARTRSRKKSRTFSLTVDHIQIPNVCPILGLPLQVSAGRPSNNSPSLDRINSSEGYIPGNVEIISWRANRIKSDATPEEIAMLHAYNVRTGRVAASTGCEI